MFRLVMHSIRMRRAQSVATAVSVGVTCAVLFALALTALGVQAGMQVSRARFGADVMAVPADAAADMDTGAYLFTGSPAGMYMSADVAGELSAVRGVGRVTAQFYGQTLDSSCCSASVPARLVGYDAATDWVITPWTGLEEGRALQDYEVVIGAGIAGDFPQGKGSVLGHAVQVAAVMDATGTDLDYSILMDIDAVRALSAANEAFDATWAEYGDPAGLVSAVMVQADEDYIEKGCDGDRSAGIALLASAVSDVRGVAAIQSSRTLEQVQGNLDALFSVMLAAGVLLAVASVLLLVTRFAHVAHERRSEVALYRALGASAHDVRVLIVGEAALLVGAGLAGGLAAGIALFLAVPHMLVQAGTFPFLAPGLGACVGVGLACAAGCAVACLGAVAVPLRRAGRVDPAAAMQMGDI